ncbi:MAG: bifunctional metallophosphatase/5'-nucleotidase, partial [Clostridia bacterium]|nr:bifunctional metallophosphatase/5'-nucleotidase [Clostridia bacterium]
MKKFLKVTVICLILALAIIPFAVMAAPSETDNTVTVLFTHDLHSHFLPIKTQNGESGGYARLYTLLQEERAKAKGAVVTLDAGDFSMGSFFQTIYATDAAELRILSDLGVDATTLGNHEFDFRQSGLVDMLNNAVAKGTNNIPIVLGNYYPPEDAKDAWDAYRNYGIKDYTVIEKDGVRFAVFGL